MSAITLNVLKPSVNNLSARIFVRAAGLDSRSSTSGARRRRRSSCRRTRRT